MPTAADRGRVRLPYSAGAPTISATPASIWLAAGVSSTQVAEWVGHPVGVLHRIHAKVIAGQEDTARERIDRAPGPTADAFRSTHGPQTAGNSG